MSSDNDVSQLWSCAVRHMRFFLKLAGDSSPALGAGWTGGGGAGKGEGLEKGGGVRAYFTQIALCCHQLRQLEGSEPAGIASQWGWQWRSQDTLQGLAQQVAREAEVRTQPHLRSLAHNLLGRGQHFPQGHACAPGGSVCPSDLARHL